MNNLALYHLASNFKLLKLKVFIQLEQDTVFPAFKGSMLHGWFGHALKQADEQAFFICYGEHSAQQPKPYLICPSDDHKTHWHQGELFSFEISLFGDATKLIDPIVIALKLGEKMGLGSMRTPFKVISISTITANGLKTGAHVLTLEHYLVNKLDEMPELNRIELALAISTPMRLKYNGQVVKKQAPPLEFWINAILRRLTQLSRFWVTDNQDLLNDLYAQRPRISHCETTSHCYFEDWQRFSKKEQSNLPFGGLKGQVSYYGEISQALPLLILGEQLHLGGKTTFGLGKYQLIH